MQKAYASHEEERRINCGRILCYTFVRKGLGHVGMGRDKESEWLEKWESGWHSGESSRRDIAPACVIPIDAVAQIHLNSSRPCPLLLLCELICREAQITKRLIGKPFV